MLLQRMSSVRTWWRRRFWWRRRRARRAWAGSLVHGKEKGKTRLTRDRDDTPCTAANRLEKK